MENEVQIPANTEVKPAEAQVSQTPKENQLAESPLNRAMSVASKAPENESKEAEKKAAEAKAEEEKKKAEEKAKGAISESKETEEAKRLAEEQKQKEEAEKLKQQQVAPAEIEQLRKKLSDAETVVAEYKKDPIGTLKKNHPEVFENLKASSDPDKYISEWQQTELLGELKKQFPDKVSDDWMFDPAEAYTAGTPSYKYRIMTEEKRESIAASNKAQKDKEEAIVSNYAKQRDADIKHLMEVYKLDEPTLQQKLKEFDSIHDKVQKGELPPEKHPLSIRSLYRGVFFDELVKIHEKQAADAAVSELKKLYAEKGIVLPDILPTDLTAQPATNKAKEQENAKKKGSPMERQMAQYAE